MLLFYCATPETCEGIPMEEENYEITKTTDCTLAAFDSSEYSNQFTITHIVGGTDPIIVTTFADGVNDGLDVYCHQYR